MMRRGRLSRLAAVVGLAALIVATASCSEDRQLVGLAPEDPSFVDQQPLPDVSVGGADFALTAADGGLLVVYFGFTNCPDVCPGTLTAVNRALGELGDDAERVEVAMVSVDPERDREGIADYVDSFVPGGHAVVSDDLSAVRRVALSFGADFVSNSGGDPEHTDALYAVDDAGQLLVTWPYPTDHDDIAGDIEQLLGRYDDA